MFTNETKIDVETTLEVHGKCGIISTSEEKNTDKQKKENWNHKYVDQFFLASINKCTLNM